MMKPILHVLITVGSMSVPIFLAGGCDTQRFGYTDDAGSADDIAHADDAASAGDAGYPPIPAPIAAPVEMGGERLRPIFLVASDGAKQFFAWRDTSRDEECRFVEVQPGEIRCLPWGAWYEQVFLPRPSSPEYTAVYADGACTEIVATTEPTCETPTVAMTMTNCPRRVTVRSLEGNVATAGYGGQFCQAINHDPFPNSHFRLGAEIPLSSFVGATVMLENFGSLSARIHVGDDGARQFAGWYDARFESECFFKPTNDGMRCIPPSTDRKVFRDDRCSDFSGLAVGLIDQSPFLCDRPPAALIEWSEPPAVEGTICADVIITRVDVLGAPVSSSGYVRTSGGHGMSACAAPMSMESIYPVVREISGELVSGSPALAQGGARLEPTLLSGHNLPIKTFRGRGPGLMSATYLSSGQGTYEGGGVVRDSLEIAERELGDRGRHGFRDRELGVLCRFAMAKDGKMRCLPLGDRGGFVYDDAMCTRPVGLTGDGGYSTCPPPEPEYRLVSEGMICDRISVFRDGPPVSVASAHILGAAGCQPLGPQTVPSLDEVPLENFVEATFVVEQR